MHSKHDVADVIECMFSVVYFIYNYFFLLNLKTKQVNTIQFNYNSEIKSHKNKHVDELVAVFYSKSNYGQATKATCYHKHKYKSDEEPILASHSQ